MTGGQGERALVPVRVVGLPLDVYQRAAEHNDEFLREFALIRKDAVDHVPARLLQLLGELRARFGAFTRGPAGEIEEALARGETAVDLH